MWKLCDMWHVTITELTLELIKVSILEEGCLRHLLWWFITGDRSPAEGNCTHMSETVFNLLGQNLGFSCFICRRVESNYICVYFSSKYQVVELEILLWFVMVRSPSSGSLFGLAIVGLLLVHFLLWQVGGDDGDDDGGEDDHIDQSGKT